jgi:hypothetical protein
MGNRRLATVNNRQTFKHIPDSRRREERGMMSSEGTTIDAINNQFEAFPYPIRTGPSFTRDQSLARYLGSPPMLCII